MNTLPEELWSRQDTDVGRLRNANPIEGRWKKWRLVHDLRAVNEIVEDMPARVPILQNSN